MQPEIQSNERAPNGSRPSPPTQERVTVSTQHPVLAALDAVAQAGQRLAGARRQVDMARAEAGAAWVLSTIRELNPGVTVAVEYPTCPEGHALTTGADCSKCRWDRDQQEYAADPRNCAYERRYWQRAAREHRERGDVQAAQQCERNAERWAS